MARRKKLNIRQLEAIIACNQSDGYLKQAARESLQRLTIHRKITRNKPGIAFLVI